MTSRLWILTILIYILVPYRVAPYDNVTTSKKGLVRNELNDLISEDEYMQGVSKTCKSGSLYACLESGAGSVILDLMNSARDPPARDEETTDVTLIKTTSISSNQWHYYNADTEGTTGRIIQPNGFIGFLTRAADKFLRTTGLVVDLNDDVTEGGIYKPRFIDEIYSEIDTLEDKTAKPNRRHEFKKLFIPLLLILKLFKLKLLVFLPVILGLASFKKIIALLVIILPGIIGYFKLCKPDLGHTYGSFGHSNFYNSPPSGKQKQYQDIMQHSPIYQEEYAHKLAYQSYRKG